MSEWMKIMLEEIFRKKNEAEQARIEEQRRGEEGAQGAQGAESALCYSPRSAPPE